MKRSGSYLDLEEARQANKVAEFAKNNPGTETEVGRFDALLELMAKTPPATDQTSVGATSEGYSEIQTPRDTSEDADD